MTGEEAKIEKAKLQNDIEELLYMLQRLQRLQRLRRLRSYQRKQMLCVL